MKIYPEFNFDVQSKGENREGFVHDFILSKRKIDPYFKLQMKRNKKRPIRKRK